MMKIILSLVFTITLSSMNLYAEPIISDQKSAQALIEDLKQGGHIIYMRHGITKRKDKNLNKALLDLSRCDTQRNLTDAGRSQVARIGRAIKSLNIPIGSVTSSPYCRTLDTATAVFTKYTIDDKLVFSISKAQAESAMLGSYLKNLMLNSNDTINNTVIVGHTANLKDGLDIWPKPEGVIVVFQKRDNQIVFKGMIKPTDWPE